MQHKRKNGSISYTTTPITEDKSNIITQNGRWVCARIYCRFSTALTADTQLELGALSGVDKPTVNYRGICGGGSNDNLFTLDTPCYVAISNDTNKVFVRTPPNSSIKAIFINAVYETR